MQKKVNMLLEHSMSITWKESKQLLLLLRKNVALPFYRLEALVSKFSMQFGMTKY